tara:strand:- start:721 stop:1671 length:951 start_codon:yes stop_codon:yes gene_type:complete
MGSVCKECGKIFKNDNGLHRHIKVHQMSVAEYYTKHYPRKNQLTGEPLPFKNKFDYFNTDFSTRAQMIKWCDKENSDKVNPYILKQLKNRVDQKQLKYAPNHIEIEINKLPPIDVYKRNFGGYGQACKELGLEPIYNKGITKDFFRKKNSIEEITIHVDTREQKPLSFKNTLENKLDFGDYTMGGDNYTYTYVDRKSEGDFKGTLGGGFKRFRRELQRAKDFNSYLYVVTESSIKDIQRNNNFGPHKSNLAYLWHNMRLLTHEFKGHCQFLFTGNRTNSQLIIPKLLYYGKDLWNVDLQYFIDNNDMDSWTATGEG